MLPERDAEPPSHREGRAARAMAVRSSIHATGERRIFRAPLRIFFGIPARALPALRAAALARDHLLEQACAPIPPPLAHREVGRGRGRAFWKRDSTGSNPG